MKRIGFLYGTMCELNNIKFAIIETSKGKRGRFDVENTLSNIDKRALEIQNILITESYIPSEYKTFSIREGVNNKKRDINAPKFFPDQIIHKLLILTIKDILMRGMYYFSCASIENRGIHFGMKYLKKWLNLDRRHTKYCLKLDVHHFFPSINQNKLKELFTYIIKDQQILNLINIIINSVDEGIPIGNYTSQWFANFYLQNLDHFIKESLGISYYMRYMDDMVILGNNKKELHYIKTCIDNFLIDYSLNIKDNWQVFKIDNRGIDFLGFRFFHEKTILRKSLMINVLNQVKKTYKCLDIKNAYSMISYYSWLQHSNSYNMKISKIDSYINIEECKQIISEYNKKKEIYYYE